MSTRSARSLRRASLAVVEKYSGTRAAVPIDLSDNTNRWGMPPAAVEAITRFAPERCTRYPEAYDDSLKVAIAKYAEVPVECVVTGCGSDDVLDAAIRAFGDPGSTIAIPDPSFTMVPAFARMNSLEPALIPLTRAYEPDIDAMLARNPRVTYLCSPNNPTGTLVPRAAIERLADRAAGVVIVDEAYAEFAGVSVADLAVSAPNVLVVRTMSKAFGLAGLRVGYAIGAPELVAEVEKSRGPYRVSVVGAEAAIAALRYGTAWMRERVSEARRARARLAAELYARGKGGGGGLEPVESRANFVLLPLQDALRRADRMRERGVAVRAYANLAAVSPALARTQGGAIRITVAPWEEMQAALAALDEALGETS